MDQSKSETKSPAPSIKPSTATAPEQLNSRSVSKENSEEKKKIVEALEHDHPYAPIAFNNPSAEVEVAAKIAESENETGKKQSAFREVSVVQQSKQSLSVKQLKSGVSSRSHPTTLDQENVLQLEGNNELIQEATSVTSGKKAPVPVQSMYYNMKSAAPSLLRQVRLNEFGYGPDALQQMNKRLGKPQTASMQPSSRSLLTAASETKRKAKAQKKKKKRPKTVVRRMHNRAFADVMHTTLHRNYAELASRMVKVLKYDLKTGKDESNFKIGGDLCKGSSSQFLPPAELEDFEEKTEEPGASDYELLPEPISEVLEIEEYDGKPLMTKTQKEIAPKHKVTSTKDSLHFRKKKEKELQAMESLLKNTSRRNTGDSIEVEVLYKKEGKSTQTLPSKSSQVGKPKVRSTKDMKEPTKTPSEIRRNVGARKRQKNRKTAKELLEEIIALKIFANLRGDDDEEEEVDAGEIYRSESDEEASEDDEYEGLEELAAFDPEVFGSSGGTEPGTSRKTTSKQERKFMRKEGILLNQVARQLNIPRSNDPTSNVMIWGAGLMFGTLKAQLMDLFHPPPIRIHFYVDKPYCTLIFFNSDDAERAREEFTGRQPLTQQVMYIGYLEKEPPVEDQELLAPFDEQPRGLKVYENFITEEEETELVLQFLQYRTDAEGKDLDNRWVKHFGYAFNYDTNNVDENSPLPDRIPSYLYDIIIRMCELGVMNRKPDQLTVTIYRPGQGIPPHVDTHSAFESPIVSISLWSDIVMDFRMNDQFKSVILPQRSLLVLDEMARYAWKHGIAERTIDIIPDDVYKGVTSFIRKERMSLTFRMLRRPKECFCAFPQFCDTQQGKITGEMAARLEKELVHDVYDQIATHFSSTRHTPWPKVKEFVQSLGPGNSMLDIGCGNGKNLNLGHFNYEVGIDMSKELLDIARTEISAEAVQSNCLNIPFMDGSFDAAICIAVLHHLCTEERRLAAASELLRVVRFGGQGLIYVWAKDQHVNEVKSAYARQRERKTELFGSSKKCAAPKNYSFLPVHDHEGDFAQKDMLVPWTKVDKSGLNGDGNVKVHHRYYHLFEKGELEQLLKKVNPPPRILESYYDQGNWCVRFVKEEVGKSIDPGATIH